MGRKLATRRQYNRLRQKSSLRCQQCATDFEFVVSNRYDHLDRRVQKITPEATHREIKHQIDEGRPCCVGVDIGN